MFTGIVKDIGSIIGIEEQSFGKRLYITTDFDLDVLPHGGSVACNGVCLSIDDIGEFEKNNWFNADLSPETLQKTTFSSIEIGQLINLELPLRVGDPLGGHMVTGHVDGVAEVIETIKQGENLIVSIAAPEELSKYIATKGSITINGVSLTVNEVSGRNFRVNLIPITCAYTTLADLDIGIKVNLEVDIISRYLDRLLENRT